MFGKLYARTHLQSDRWYKLGRELLYGRLEDEKPFQSVRRLVQQEDYALRLFRDNDLPTPAPYGVVELTPEREYLLVIEFFDGAVEMGDAEVTDRVMDSGLAVVRKLWDAGLAHRDIKPSNLLVRDQQVLLIDVAFADTRPTPWRQAVDLANMMLCLALRSSPERVYRALRQFTAAEIGEAFAAARGLALPSQLRRALRARGLDLHAEFTRLLPAPPRPVSIQRWNLRRIALWGLVLLLPWPPRTGPLCSATREPSRPRSAPTPWAAGIWSRCGWRHNRSRRRRWCRAYGHHSQAGRWRRWPSTTAGRWSPSTTMAGPSAVVLRLTAACDPDGAVSAVPARRGSAATSGPGRAPASSGRPGTTCSREAA